MLFIIRYLIAALELRCDNVIDVPLPAVCGVPEALANAMVASPKTHLSSDNAVAALPSRHDAS